MVEKITYAEWVRRGTELFGPDMMTWRMECPVCNNVATPNDYYAFKDKGATPDSATCECLGRYTGKTDFAKSGEGPCNYAGYGLFQLSPLEIETEGGKTRRCFSFASPVIAATPLLCES